jgi:predicted neutral ceramidase superfamily lipid hydrolase
MQGSMVSSMTDHCLKPVVDAQNQFGAEQPSTKNGCSASARGIGADGRYRACPPNPPDLTVANAPLMNWRTQNGPRSSRIRITIAADP